MHEADKLAEAEYFLLQMLALQDDRQAHKHNLSAFLSAARSVMQFAHEEARTKRGGQQWYDSRMQNDVVKFFRDKRDVSIHSQPVGPTPDVHIQVDEESVVVTEGKFIYEQSAIGPLPVWIPAVETGAVTFTLFYKFAD